MGAFNITEIPGLQELWAETLGDLNVCIAILDGPVDQSHPSLTAANLTQLGTLVTDIPNQGPASHHGTHVASVIFGQHDGPVKGIAPQCRGLIVPIFQDGADGSIAPCSQLDLARAISQSVQEGAQIINISGGELTPSDSAHPLLADTVRVCAKRGILIVAAAGNQGCDCLHIPGALPSVLAVGAMDSQGVPLDFSNWGEKYQTQGILAPGEGILGATPSGGTATNSGTSYATPIVSGIAALLLSLQLKNKQKTNPHSIRIAILSSAIGCEEQPVPNCRRLLAGRLNIKEAMSKITKGGSTMSDTSEIQESTRPQVIENAETKTSAARMLEPDTGVTAADNNGFKESESPPQPSPASSPVPQHGEESISKGSEAPSRVKASDCGCGGETSAQQVFVIGQLGYDFGTEARRDSIMQHMESPTDVTNSLPNPNNPAELLAYLEENPWEADALIWTIECNATPMYAIKPKDAFAIETYQRLRQFLHEQIEGEIERISVGGTIQGSVRLLSGQVVPSICPNLRCLYSWNTAALIDAVVGTSSGESEKPKKGRADESKREAVRNFLERVYNELCNFGMDPCEKAINAAATDALTAAKIFEDALKDNMQLDTIECEQSTTCRPGSDCWDVKLIFFDPENQLTRARKVYRFTFDLADCCPVRVGAVRSWFVR